MERTDRCRGKYTDTCKARYATQGKDDLIVIYHQLSLIRVEPRMKSVSFDKALEETDFLFMEVFHEGKANFVFAC